MAEHVVSFELPFVRGKGRVRFVRQTGRTYTPDSTAQAMHEVRDAWERASGGQFAEGGKPVCVSIITRRPLPRSRPKGVLVEPDTYKPDADNIAKLVLDALNGTAWEDDTQVTSLSVMKMPRERERGPWGTSVTVKWNDGGEEKGGGDDDG